MAVTIYVDPINASGGSPSYDAKVGRLTNVGLLAAPSTVARHVRSGVRISNGFDLSVSVASLTATVQTGQCIVDAPGTMQGAYSFASDATVNLAITAPDATLSRRDTIYVRVYDDEYDSSGQRGGDILYIAGTPSGSPTAPDLPAAPAATMRLADLLVPPGGAITVEDKRQWLSALGGRIRCTSSTRPTNVPSGTDIFETDTGREMMWTGTEWVATYDPNPFWVPLAYASGWTTHESTNLQAAYRYEHPWVRLRGRIKKTSGTISGNAGQALATLPNAIQPGATYRFMTGSHLVTSWLGAYVDVNPAGIVTVGVPPSYAVDWVEITGAAWTVEGA